jgi:hypothetical protein
MPRKPIRRRNRLTVISLTPVLAAMDVPVSIGNVASFSSSHWAIIASDLVKSACMLRKRAASVPSDSRAALV